MDFRKILNPSEDTHMSSGSPRRPPPLAVDGTTACSSRFATPSVEDATLSSSSQPTTPRTFERPYYSRHGLFRLDTSFEADREAQRLPYDHYGLDTAPEEHLKRPADLFRPGSYFDKASTPPSGIAMSAASISPHRGFVEQLPEDSGPSSPSTFTPSPDRFMTMTNRYYATNHRAENQAYDSHKLSLLSPAAVARPDSHSSHSSHQAHKRTTSAPVRHHAQDWPHSQHHQQTWTPTVDLYRAQNGQDWQPSPRNFAERPPGPRRYHSKQPSVSLPPTLNRIQETEPGTHEVESSHVKAQMPIRSSGRHQRTSSADPGSPEDDIVPADARCEHADVCDTDSPLRKAVSHIFGRNKICTRNITDIKWVWMCRKHYQRSRYRSNRQWAITQCDLVMKQIGYIDEWSAENRRLGKPGSVNGWRFAMRKREQVRVDKVLKGEADRGSLTAVPAWLRAKCGPDYKYTSEEVIEAVARLGEEIANSGDCHFPDIEFLPDITSSSVSRRHKESSRSHAKRGSRGSRGSIVGDELPRRYSLPSHGYPPPHQSYYLPNHGHPLPHQEYAMSPVYQRH